MAIDSTITEGGNVFRDSQGQPATQRINQSDVAPTVAWLERLTGLELLDNMLGSTGRKPTSGDLDLGVDPNKISKEQLYTALTDWAKQQKQDPRDWVAKSGISVHFKTPITGRTDRGYVQTDFMFLPDVDFGRWYMSSSPDSAYKGVTRNVMINSLAKVLGMKINQNLGLVRRDNNELITRDPDEIARLLLTPKATQRDLESVETIVAALAQDPKKEAKLADFRDYANRMGIAFQESVEETDVSMIARLRDRIVNQGMQMIVEAARIEHPEDLVFDRGSAGIDQALKGIVSAAQNPSTTTVKWDGKPAVIFGRKPNGQFVLTDKSGFTSKTYDGLATSADQLATIMRQRSGERGELIAMYQRLFPLLQAATPKDFQGYLQADLLYSERPAQRDGKWVFQPNTVTYSVPVDSDLGQKIGQSQVGLAVHTYIPQPGAAGRPADSSMLSPVKGLLVLDPRLQEPQQIKLNAKLVKDIQTLASRYGSAIDRLFNPTELRARRITDLPQLFKQYINSRVRAGTYDDILYDFGGWIKTKAPAKVERIYDWVRENKQATAALFRIFLGISSLKNDLVRQLDSQGQSVQAQVNNEPGHEGYVGQGMKFVDRMRFSQANFARNNPELL